MSDTVSDTAGPVSEEDQRVDELMTGLLADEYGRVTPSVYETGRLVSSAPWLDGHHRRLVFLLANQRPDGSWGHPDGYDLVPTLSAVEALLTATCRGEDLPTTPDGIAPGALTAAAERGLAMLLHRLAGHTSAPVPVPDTIAAELVVPWLVDEINGYLDRLAVDPSVPSGAWPTQRRLSQPAGAGRAQLDRLRSAAQDGQALPAKIWHSLEVLGGRATGARGVHPVDGAVGASPAATAAWLGAVAGTRPSSPVEEASVGYLHRVQRRGGGPVPGVTPITFFERAWVINTLAAAGVGMTVPESVVASLENALGSAGAPAGPGLPADSDDTAAVLYALANLGRPRSAAILFSYETEANFCCFPDERTPSTSANAHILDAICAPVPAGARDQARWHAAAGNVAQWLADQQQADGSWWDKWHASPYYATACCALSLERSSERFGEPAGGPRAAEAVRRAVLWLLDSQRADGSWGRWVGTDEETAYAVQTLLSIRSTIRSASRSPSMADGIARSAARGCAFLLRNGANGQGRDGHDYPPLWHDKDLYTPVAVVQAARLAALHLAATRPAVARQLGEWAGPERHPFEEVVRNRGSG